MAPKVIWIIVIVATSSLSVVDTYGIDAAFVNSVSYFGGSYQFLPAEAIPGSSPTRFNGTRTSIEAWFKTARSDCLLLLANGTKSSCALRLKAGRLEVEFRVNGSDKIQFLSPMSLGHFHDSQWHKVAVQRAGDEISLSIDDKNLTFRTQQIDHASSFVLDDGLHLGSLGPGNRASRTNFRGCLADLRYNGQDVFRGAFQTSNDRLVSQGTQSSCARQFDSENSELPFQFLDIASHPNESTPYLTFDLNYSDEKSLKSLHFELRTSSTDSPLFSTTSDPVTQPRSCFCIDIIDGSFRVSNSDPRGRRIHKSKVRLDDGRWHSIDLRFSNDICELIIDNKTEVMFASEPLLPSLNKSIRFGSREVCDQEEAPSEGAFRGCLHNVAMNHKHFTLLNISSSREIDVGCDDFCSANDQSQNSACQDAEQWPAAFPEPDPFPVFPRSNLADDIEQKPALIENAIRVKEGGTVRLEPRHFYFLPPSSRIAIPNRNIVFHVNHKPGHGKLTLLEHAVSTFTYQDVIDGKVNYTHDGLEQHEDTVELDLEIRGLVDGFFTAGLNVGNPSSGHWQSQSATDQRYALAVAVSPLNDRPVIELPNGPVLRLAQNTRLRISNREILVMDSDHDPADVKIKVTYSTPNSGFFEHVKKPGLPATTFTQEDILNNYITYFHFGFMNGQTTLVASDPLDESKPVTLNIHAFLVDFRQISNEGLDVFHNGYETITPSNLEFSSNAKNQSSDITYRIVRSPKYGRIEYEDESGDWHSTKVFNQSQVDDGKIRYNSRNEDAKRPQSNPSRDSLTFTVSTLNASSPIEHEFEIRFVRTTIKVFNPTPFVLNNTLKLFFSRTYLFAHTSPRVAFAEEIVYQLVRPPMYGLLYLVIDASTSRNRVLGLSSNFTQADIDQERVFYQLRYVHYTVINDYFVFKTTALGSTTNEQRYDMTYLPGEDDFKLINKTLVVQEGSLQRVTNATLHVETKESKEFDFSIYLAPKHGSFTLVSGSQTRQLVANDAFTTADIREGRLFYRHDDSETQNDVAYLIAKPSAFGRGFAPQVPFWYSIKTNLVNDNQPKRYDSDPSQSSRVFYIIRKGERVVTNRDLWYVDADTDFDPLQLRYSFPNRPADGGIFYAKRPDVPFQEFTQEDVNSGSVLFKHFGPNDVFSWPFSVSDGKHHTPGQFLVNASSPFLRERRNTGIKVQRGSMSILSGYNLTMETNLNVATSDIVYKIISPPRYGKLLFVDPKAEEGYAVDTFTQKDVDHFRILYAHNNVTSAASKIDWIAATVYAGALEETVKIGISIFDADDSLLRIVHIRQLRVARGGVAVVDSNTLKAEHVYFTPKQITFLVKKQPSAGTLVLDSGSNLTTTTSFWHGSVSSSDRFTQYDIDEGKLHYVHRLTNAESGVVSDEIIFDIYAPSVALSGVAFRVGVVDRELTLTTRNLTVDKGGSKVIRVQHLSVKSNFDAADDHSSTYLFSILKQPEHGWLQLRGADDEDDEEAEGEKERIHDEELLVTFKYKDVLDRKVQYVHDGSKTWRDEFTVVAKLVDDARMQSPPKTVHVKIKHANEKDPEILRNEPLELHSRREATILSEHLHVIDSDTPADEITFRVTSPTGGHLAFANNSSKPIVEFSQKDIDDGKVVFVYTGGSDGGFYFSVSDGLHQLPAQKFLIHAIELSVSLAVKQRLTLAPGATVVLTAEYLKAAVGSADPSRILFTVTKQPKFGVLLRNGVSTHPLTFTQQDVNRDLIAYRQSKPIQKWEMRDGFSFIISLNETEAGERLMPLEDDNKFRIFITYGAMDVHETLRYVRTSKVKVRESDKTYINASHMNISELAIAVSQSSPLVFELAAPPDYGWLQLRGHNLSERSQFAPQDLLNNWVVYKHVVRPTSPNYDRMQFDVFPIDEPRHPLRLRLDVDVLPSPLRKQRFQLKYLTASLKVIQGTPYQITTRDFLILGDPSIISFAKYRVIRQATNGFFAFTTAPTKPIFEFTQEDINENRLDFVHNVSTGLANSSTFLFVSTRPPSDAKSISEIESGTPQILNHTINIYVDKLTLSCQHFQDLTYRQGAQNVLVSNAHLIASSNGPPTGIFYNVTEPPRNGVLTWMMETKREPAILFTQADVDARRIFYTPLKMDSSSDSLTVTVFNDFVEIPGKTLRVRVTPALEHSDVRVRANGTFLISEDVLKIGPEIVDRDPYFHVVRQPHFGLLVHDDAYRNVSVSHNATSALESITGFANSDVKMKRIRYVNTTPVKHHVLEDGFVFDLRAKGVQTARVRFRIWIVPGGGPVPTVEPSIFQPPGVTAFPGLPLPDTGTDGRHPHTFEPSSIYPVIAGGRRTPQPTTPGVIYPEIILDHTIVIFILVPVLFFAVMFMIVRRVRVAKERERRQLKDKLIAQQQANPHLQSRPDLLDATLYSMGSSPNTQDSGLSTSASVILRDRPYNTGERTASIKSASKPSAGTIPRNGGHTLPGRTLSLEKANKGMLTMASPAISAAPLASTSPRGYQSFFAHESPPPTTRMVTFDPGRTEIISSVPMCKVTPLMPKPAASTCSSSSGDDFRYAYQYSSSASEPEFKSDRVAVDRTPGHRHQRKGPRSPIKQMKLKENQYWV